MHGNRAPGSEADVQVGSPGEAAADAAVPTCLRCGFHVRSRPWGCKNPCPNCGFVYPLGDCSD